MSKFALVFDPVRNTPFAVVIRNENRNCASCGPDVEIKALNAMAQSWSNSQFDEIEIPNGMAITEYKTMNSAIRNVIDNYEFMDAKSIDTVASSRVQHVARHQIASTKTEVSSLLIRRFSKKSKLAAVDFKAKKFISSSKKSSVNKNSLKNTYIRSIVGSGSSRRISTSIKQALFLDLRHRRVARRLRDISPIDGKSLSADKRINMSLINKHLGFRQL